MSNILPVKAPKPDAKTEQLRQEAEARAAEQERLAAANDAERRRSIALGFRGRSSLISGSTSAGFGSQGTLGG